MQCCCFDPRFSFIYINHYEKVAVELQLHAVRFHFTHFICSLCNRGIRVIDKMFTSLYNLDLSLKCGYICGNCLVQTRQESVCCREISAMKSSDKIPHSMSCITENENFTAVCTNAAVIQITYNQYLENEGPIDNEPPNGYVSAHHQHKNVCL